MEIFYLSLYVSIATFLISLFYYGLIFRKPIVNEIYGHSTKKMQKHDFRFSVWFGSFFLGYVAGLVYALLGYTLGLFEYAPLYMPYIISTLFWFLIASVDINSALRVKQSAIITFIHIGYWFTVCLLFALLFPLLHGLMFR